jgi:hypothetical protein
MLISSSIGARIEVATTEIPSVISRLSTSYGAGMVSYRHKIQSAHHQDLLRSYNVPIDTRHLRMFIVKSLRESIVVCIDLRGMLVGW